MAKKSSVKNNDMNMKIVVVVALIAVFVGGYLLARAKYKPQILELNKMVLSKDEEMNKMKVDANKVVMKDSKMWVVENGMVRAMEEDIIMPNGDKVMQDGKVMKADGKEVMLQNGEAVDMDGNIVPNGAENIDTGSVRSF